MRAGGIGVGIAALYVVLAGLAPDLLGTKLIGSMSLGFLGGVGLVAMTWGITLAYLRRSDRVWAPLERAVQELATEQAVATGRFARTGATERESVR